MRYYAAMCLCYTCRQVITSPCLLGLLTELETADTTYKRQEYHPLTYKILKSSQRHDKKVLSLFVCSPSCRRAEEVTPGRVDDHIFIDDR